MATAIFALLALIAAVSGTPISTTRHCLPLLWDTVGNHDQSPCVRNDEDTILELQAIKKYYSDLIIPFQDQDASANPHLKNLIEEVGKLLKHSDVLADDADKASVLCTACKAAVDAIKFYLEAGESEKKIVTVVEDLCKTFKVQTDSVCAGVAQLFGPEIVSIVNSSSVEVEPLSFCSFLLSDECGDIRTPDWEITLPNVPKPPMEKPEPPAADAPKLKVLHIADTHFDRFYAEGAKVYCDEPLCCRPENGQATGDEKAAGKFGDWRCDTPEITLDSMLEHAASTHPDIDHIVWTGDLPAHDVWKQTQQDSLDVLQITVSKISQYFPSVPVFPAVGNHESSPVNNFPSPSDDFSIAWLYDKLDSEWSRWLSENTSATIRKGAFYSTLLRPGLRIVSLNTNYCYTANWWLVINSTDPAEELQWLVQVLQAAEDNQEKVHIIAHIPPGQNDCLPVWRDNFYKIMTRYEGTVSGSFFGHTHKDEFEIYYDVEDETRAVGVGYIGPSVTTYTSLNPGYRVYYVDGDRENSTRMVTDHETWVLDLERSNKEGQTFWYKSYTVKEEYQMTSLLPEDWDKLYQRFKVDEHLLQVYYQHYTKDSPVRGSCDESCKRSRLCAIRSCGKYGEPELN